MQKSETVKLLTFKHSIEGGEVTETEVEAWHHVIGDLPYIDAFTAAGDHYRYAEVDDMGRAVRLMPRHIVQACEEPVRNSSWAGNITEQRLAAEAAGRPVLTPGVDGV